MCCFCAFYAKEYRKKVSPELHYIPFQLGVEKDVIFTTTVT